MPPLSRLLTFAIAAALGLSLAAPAEAARKKQTRSSSHQSRSHSTGARNLRPRPKAAPRPVAAEVDSATRLNQLYEAYWQASLKLNPLQATLQGDPRYNDQLPNLLSAAFRQQSHELNQEWLQKIEAIGPSGLHGQDLLSYQIFVRDARLRLDAERFPSWMLPINQYYNVANVMAMLGSGTGAQPFESVRDYDNWSRRSLEIPDLFNQAIANMREGIRAGVVQPKLLMRKVLPQLDALITPTAEQSIFWAPVRNLPEHFSAEDKARISAEYKRMIEYRIMPAYRALRGFIATEYLPACRDSDGRAALPNGAAWYAYDLRQSTGASDLTPAQAHALGLAQVAHLREQLQALMKQRRARGSMQKFIATMLNDPRQRFRNEDELLDAYRRWQVRVTSAVPKLFSLLPKASLDIKPVEAFRSQSAAAAAYLPPSADGDRPGTLYVNTATFASQHRWAVRSLFLHEAIPGHHLQLGLQQELKDLPRFRRVGGETAFVEGWGLYSEGLASALGLDGDANDAFGVLYDELWHALRLVVDTGVNSKGWTRQRAIDYLRENIAVDDEQAEAEVERAMAIPAQSLAHEVGLVRLRTLREQASRTLGPTFDIRAFHTEVLKDGSVPLDILSEKIERWTEQQRGTGTER